MVWHFWRQTIGSSAPQRRHSIPIRPIRRRRALCLLAVATAAIQRQSPSFDVGRVSGQYDLKRMSLARRCPNSRGDVDATCRRGVTVLATAETESMPELWRPGPAEVRSGPAKKALYLMKEQPMLFDGAIEDEFANLMGQKGMEQSQFLPSDVKPDALVLRRRVQEVREKERHCIAMELLYLKVCNNFVKLSVPLIPTMKTGGDASFSHAGNLKGLTDIYSRDALEMVKEHLLSMLGAHANPVAGSGIIRISLFQAGQAYLVSSMMGYYVRRVDARYQLEKLMGSLGSRGEGSGGMDEADVKCLKDYLFSFGPDELQRMTSIASTEASAALETHVSALFGDLRRLKENLLEAVGMVMSHEEAQTKLKAAIDSDEVESIRLNTDDLRRLVLEALAFGALLYDAEKQVDSLYELTPSSPHLGPLTGDGPDPTRMLPE